MLLGAVIPVGQALETEGGAVTNVELLLGVGSSYSFWFVFGLVILIAMFLPEVINNAPAVVLMAPIAICVANEVGTLIYPFLLAVAI